MNWSPFLQTLEGESTPTALRGLVTENTAGLMLTNPNTLGLFEDHIAEMAEIVHAAGGLMYYDGANLNAIMGTLFALATWALMWSISISTRPSPLPMAAAARDPGR